MNSYGKWSFILSLASVLAMVCYCLSAWLLYERYCHLFDAGYTSFYVPLCGKSMQYFIWWGAGLAGWLFISAADSGSRAHRACIWGMLQFISAWVLVYPAAVLGRMNDGSGMLFILFAPLATLPSFAAALLAGMMQKSGQSPVTATHGADDDGVFDLFVVNFIDLELFGMTEMLKDLSVLISNCDFHSGNRPCIILR